MFLRSCENQVKSKFGAGKRNPSHTNSTTPWRPVRKQNTHRKKESERERNRERERGRETYTGLKGTETKQKVREMQQLFKSLQFILFKTDPSKG